MSWGGVVGMVAVVLRILRDGALPALAFAVMVAITTALWLWAKERADRHLRVDTHVAAEQVRTRIESWVDERVGVGTRLLEKVVADPAVEPKVFREWAEDLVGYFKGIQAVNWIDARGVIHMVVPMAGNQAALGRNLREHPVPGTRAAIAQAETSNEATRTPVIELYQGGHGFATYRAVWGPGQKVIGFINTVFRLQSLVDECLKGEPRLTRFALSLTEMDGTPVHAAGVMPSVDAQIPVWTTEVRVVDGAWTLRLAPSAAVWTDQVNVPSTWLFAAGLGLSGLSAWLLWVVRARRRDLRGQMRRTQRILSTTLDGYVLVDAEGCIVEANDAYARLVGHTADDLQRLSLRDLQVDPGEGEPDAEALTRILSARSDRFETRLRHRDGHIVEIEVSVSAVPDSPRTLRTVFARDITKRKRAEAERARLSRAVDQAAEAIIITDPRGRILYVNPAFERISGYDREEVKGKNPRLLRSDRQPAASYREMWAALLRGEIWSGRMVNRDAKGAAYEVESTIAPLRDATGQVVNYVAVQRDMTRERSMEEQLRQSQKMEAVGRLAGGVAHDFNNLLTVIAGYCDLLLHGRDTPPAVRDRVGAIARAADQAGALTRQLLTFSRRQVLEPRVLDVNAVVGGLEEMLRRLIGADVELAFNLQAEPGLVLADSAQLEQVVMNLVLNAREAMPGGGRVVVATSTLAVGDSPEPRLRSVPPGAYVVLSVGDTGHGMDAETRMRMFEPFFTTKEKEGGTGLGLSTVYGVVSHGGGHIVVDSEPDRGTTIEVLLPPAEADAACHADVDQRDWLPPGSERVLLVEDQVEVRSLTREILEACGYVVTEAEDGQAALAVFDEARRPFDVLVTDVVMPGLGGVELAQRLRELQPGLPVLYISGYAEGAVGVHGRLEDEAQFLPKPFSPGGLARAVRFALDGHAAD